MNNETECGQQVRSNDQLGVTSDGIAYRLARELEDLIELADFAMQQANNDGAEYDREEHLLDARNAVRAYKAFLKEQDVLPL